MKQRRRSTFLCASLALLLTPSERFQPPQNQLGIREVPVYYSEFREDFEGFSVWQKNGEGIAEPTYGGVEGSRAMLIKAGAQDHIEVYRLLNPYEDWQISFDLKDLAEEKKGSWLIGIAEPGGKSNTKNFKRAYFAGMGAVDSSYGVYSTQDDDINIVPSNVKKRGEFHSYSIKCLDSKIYFSVDVNVKGYLSGKFKSGRIFAHLEEGGSIVLDNVAFQMLKP